MMTSNGFQETMQSKLCWGILFYLQGHEDKALEKLNEVAEIPEGIPVILDAKRGDIASTAQAYAHALFQVMGADAVTINPYLGHEAVEPFLSDPERGVFLLCKTSNPGAADLQEGWLPGEVD